jgi:hypothetical protein
MQKEWTLKRLTQDVQSLNISLGMTESRCKEDVDEAIEILAILFSRKRFTNEY